MKRIAKELTKENVGEIFSLNQAELFRERFESKSQNLVVVCNLP